MKILISRDVEKRATVCTLTIFDKDIPPGMASWEPLTEVKKKEDPLVRVRRFVDFMEKIDEF